MTYITCAIDYPNAKPHLGHAYEKIVADALARWFRAAGKDVFLSIGTDEHGQKIYETAQKKGKDTKDFVEDLIPDFKTLFKNLSISENRFIRTTDEDHVKLVQELIKTINEKGDIYKGTYKGWYSIKEEAFLTEKELPPRDSKEWKAEIEEREEETYFFKLSKYQEEIIKFTKETDYIFPQSRKNEVLERLKEPLRDLSISRLKTKLPWGINFPLDEKHTVYVWLDALPNYLSSPKEKLNQYWPADIHVIGKDILWFHAVIWPAILLSLGNELPKHLLVHGFINDKEGQKMSKSRGNGINPAEIIKTYGADALRYYLLRTVISGDDGNFSEEDLIKRFNGELANELGNLVQRIQKLVHEHFNKKLTPQKQDLPLIDEKKLHDYMEKFLYNKVLEELLKKLHDVNAYINEKAPWKNEEEREVVLYNALEHVRILTHYFQPFIPTSAQKIAKQLNFSIIPLKELSFGTHTYSLNDPEILFPKLELPQTFNLNIKVGTIIAAEKIEGADKLLKETVDLGGETRQIVSGIAQHYKPEHLIGKKILVVCNLKPAKLRGVESQGMLLAYEHSGLHIIEPDADLGETVQVAGKRIETNQITFEQFLKSKLIIKEGKLTCEDEKLLLGNKPILVLAPDGTNVK